MKPCKQESFALQIGKNKNLYPSLTDAHLEHVSNALCPFKLKLPLSLKNTINEVCAEFLKLKKESRNEWEDSILNSLDFHYSSEKLKIIEANTNASGFLISHLLEDDKNFIVSYEKTLLKSFQTVLGSDLKEVSIIDANPETEKMYPEFLMFKDFFERSDIETEILKTKDLNLSTNKNIFIYNRDTDFYLEKNLELLSAWKNKKAVLSSSPLSYDNIASKALNEKESHLLNSEDFTSLKPFFLESLPLSDELWEKRKKYFFKPVSSFGSRGVYSGKSISRKKFESLEGAYLAQELHPPGKVTHLEQEWKYDIRAYFSEGSVQKILARVYQGQLTNFSQSGGGFALIDWME